MIKFDTVDFSERHPEEVISFYWRSVYNAGSIDTHNVLIIRFLKLKFSSHACYSNDMYVRAMMTLRDFLKGLWQGPGNDFWTGGADKQQQQQQQQNGPHLQAGMLQSPGVLTST